MKQSTKSMLSFIGSGYFLWRAVAFLVGIVLFCWLISLIFGGRGKSSDDNPQDNPTEVRDSTHRSHNPFRRRPEPVINPDNPYADYPSDLWEPIPVTDWNDSIPGVRELPAPPDNFIPPVDSSVIVTDPNDPNRQIVCNQLIVFFNSKDIKADMAEFARRFKVCYPAPGYSVSYYNPATASMLLSIPEDKLEEVMIALPGQIPGIDFRVTTNDVLNEGYSPSDPGFETAAYDQYFKLIQAYDAWDITKGSADVKVAIVDSYFDLTNPEIGSRYESRIHIPTKTTNVLPPMRSPTSNDIGAYCHGSHVAGIAIGGQDNSRGVSGIAPECSWIPVSLGDQMTTFNVMEGILYAIYHGADVVNLSIGRSFPQGIASLVPIADQVTYAETEDKRGEDLWEYVYKVAVDHNCVICTAAGNESLLMGMDPMNRSNQIVKVEAVDNTGMKAGFSNFGSVPGMARTYSTVSAPGVNLWSVSDKRCAPLWKKEGYKVSVTEGLQEMSGTSMACPVVTGAVALLKSKNKNITPDEVIKILTMTGKQTDPSKTIGPTIQIRDALDATGGELLNFDDLMKNHDLLVGKWKSTYELKLVNSVTDELIDYDWVYFVFDNPNSGIIEIHTINSHDIYTAPLSVVWSTQSLNIIQLGDAVNAENDKINKDDYICRPAVDRTLEAETIRDGVIRYTFNLQKVN